MASLSFHNRAKHSAKNFFGSVFQVYTPTLSQTEERKPFSTCKSPQFDTACIVPNEMPTRRKLTVVENRHSLRKWLARVDDRFMGTPIDIDPHDAMIHAIRIMAGEVNYCDQQIRKLHEDELFERPLETSVQQLPNGKWVTIEEKRNAEVVSRWVTLRDEALSSLVRYSKWALEVGIDERRVRVAERVAEVIAPLLSDLALDLNLSDEQKQLLPLVIDKRLRLLEAASGEEAAA